MPRTASLALTAVGVGATVAAGFSVAAFASFGSASGPAAVATTSETTTTEQGASVPYAALLTSRAEVPKPKGPRAGAGGTFALTVAHKGGTYSAKWKLTFHNLTGKAIAAHIHRARPGKAGPVIVPLCGPCSSGKAGSSKISAATATAIKSGGAYVNVHTPKNAAGEIRGQILKKK